MTSVKSFPYRRILGVTLFAAGIICGGIACGLLVIHTQTFSLKRDSAVMIGTTLPELKSSVALLDANMQAEQLFAENALASREEQASVFVLPDGPAASRAIWTRRRRSGAPDRLRHRDEHRLSPRQRRGSQ